MAPLQDSSSVREQRLLDGCCPNCGTRLYKLTTAHGAGGVVGANLSKIFRKKNSSIGEIGKGEHAAHIKMTPLTIPGVVERGQCVRCAGGFPGGGGGFAGGVVNAVPVPTVKAVPIVLKSAASNAAVASASASPPRAKPQSNTEVVLANKQKHNYGNGDISPVELKNPPEDLLGLIDNADEDPSTASSARNTGSAGDSSSKEESGSDCEESLGSEDDDSLEEIPAPSMDLCRLESDHASSSLVNRLRYHGCSDGSMDDRKPAAKPQIISKTISGGVHMSKHMDESAERIRKLREEAASIDMAILEASDPSSLKINLAENTKFPLSSLDVASLEASSKRKGGDARKKLECPSGMSPEVFYELPLEMQKEIMDQDRRSHRSRMDGNSGDRGNEGASSPSAVNIDPEMLASLPNHIRKEIIEQARQEQEKKEIIEEDEKKSESRRDSHLSKSTAAFLSECDIEPDDFENLPEEIKDDIMDQKRRQSSEYQVDHETMKVLQENKDVVSADTGADDTAALSGYDPETLASLPEDVRREVLDETRREKERRRQKERESIRPSGVGAHSVNVPAGYDPDTFFALPEDVQRELLDDAGRRSTGGMHDHGSVVTVRAHSMTGPGRAGGGVATSCTYTGEYNAMGKRHGDGELTWANGDVYTGKFKDGYIEGRGTIDFHDGTEYAGQWRKNRFHGEGTRRFNNGNVYTGNYVSGKRQGQGRCYFANGDMYVGDWKEDTIHGFGRYYYNNGHSFEGMFRNGKRNGRGKYQLTDGRVEIYRYVHDSRVGDGVRWSANRKKAWRMNDGKVTKRVSIEEAATIAKRCGPLVEES